MDKNISEKSIEKSKNDKDSIYVRLYKSIGSLIKIFEFFEWHEQCRVQLVCKCFYNDIVPMTMFQLGYYPKISLYYTIIDLCKRFYKGRAESVERRLREEDNLPFDFVKWPQHRLGVKPEEMRIDK